MTPDSDAFDSNMQEPVSDPEAHPREGADQRARQSADVEKAKSQEGAL